MKLIKTYKYKLKPNKTQEKLFNSWVSTCRALYNLALSERIMVYEMRKKSVSKYDQYNQLPELKKLHPELKSKLPCLWTRSYYSGTVGLVSEETVKKYIENQRSV